MKLSPHFDSDEFACPCCGEAQVDEGLIACLELLRLRVDAPIIITSGFRCKAHNAKVGGSPSSQHLLGRAADIIVRGLSGREIYNHACAISGLVGFGVAGRWIHLDARQGPPMLVRWTYNSLGRVQQWKEERQ